MFLPPSKVSSGLINIELNDMMIMRLMFNILLPPSKVDEKWNY